MGLTRKEFIKISSLAFSGLPFLNLSFVSCSDEKAGSLYEGFVSPPNNAKPMVRWWWNGLKIKREEIIRELDLMSEAGIGGIEINSIKFPDDADDIGTPSFEWLSDDWIQMVEVAVDGAKERNFNCDIIVGSGWPFGGKFLEKEEQTQLITFGTKKLKGPKTVHLNKEELLDSVNLELYSKNEDQFKELAYLRLAPANMEEFDMGTDLTEKLKEDQLTIDVPEGEHVFYYLVIFTGYMSVINGAPGSDGPVLNHYSKKAVQKYLNRMSDKMEPDMGGLGKSFRAMFCDSLELEGANWTVDILNEFKHRRGYDLYPYLPFVLFKTGHMGNQISESDGMKSSESVKDEIQSVRYDFYKTRLELFDERFIETFTEWCKQQNTKSRVQAYGRGYHPIEASMKIDIPECETWLRSTIGGDYFDESGLEGRAYSMINKFVSSGARLAGKKQVTCEEITNTGYVFNASLEDIKIAGDQSNLSGVTNSILHGFNYNPKEADFPGWIRYGTFFDERNPWWPFFKKWTEYKTRLSFVFQESTLISDVALMQPLADMWRKFGPQRDPFPSVIYPEYQHNVWEAIHQNGNGCDYVSENILQQATSEKGNLCFGDRKYKAVIVLKVESMQPDTAKALEAYAESGGKIIFIENAPYQAPGLENKKRNDSYVKNTIDGILENFSQNTGVYPGPEDDDMLSWYRGIQAKFDIEPYMKMDNTSSHVSQLHYQSGEKDIYFITNYNKKNTFSSMVTFDTEGKAPWLWDPEKGERYRYPYETSKNKLLLKLGPAESKLIVFEKNIDCIDCKEWKINDINREQFQLVEGPWELTLDHVNGINRTLSIDTLKDFKTISSLKSFAGIVLYKNTFFINNPDRYRFLDLGDINGISEVKINGNSLGTRWYGQHLYDLDGMLYARENNIEIKITTVLGNYVKSLTDNKVAQNWTRNQDFNSAGLIGPVKLFS